MRDCTCYFWEPANPVKILKKSRFLFSSLSLIWFRVFSICPDWCCFCQKLFLNEFQQCLCFWWFSRSFSFWISFHLVSVVIQRLEFEIPQITLVFFPSYRVWPDCEIHLLLRNRSTCFFANLREKLCYRFWISFL